MSIRIECYPEENNNRPILINNAWHSWHGTTEQMRVSENENLGRPNRKKSQWVKHFK